MVFLIKVLEKLRQPYTKQNKTKTSKAEPRPCLIPWRKSTQNGSMDLNVSATMINFNKKIQEKVMTLGQAGNSLYMTLET
jgi:hypothetical protein